MILLITIVVSLILILFRNACTIELNDKVIVTGGKYSLNRVEVYTLDGWIKELPELITGRFNHACGHYINTAGEKVKCIRQHILLYKVRCVSV